MSSFSYIKLCYVIRMKNYVYHLIMLASWWGATYKVKKKTKNFLFLGKKKLSP